MRTLNAIVADPHPGVKHGLMPPEFTMIGGNPIRANPYQLALWQSWLDFWTIVKARRPPGAKVWVTVAGDIIDLEQFNAHGGTATLSMNQADAVRCLEDVMRPALDIADRLFLVYGTEAHEGGGNALAELAAEVLGAEKDVENHSYGWPVLPMICEGVHFDVAHHPATSGSRWWTKHAAVVREAQIIHMAYLERNEPPPNIAVRGHLHFFGDSGLIVTPRTLFCPSWTLPGAFAHRIVASEIREIGGWMILCENGRATPEFVRYLPKRREPWTEPSI
jgi:hypothetical protein